MRRGWVAAALAAALALAGCGSGGHVTQGNPDFRDGAGAVDTYAQIEFLRALLISSSDAYYAGGSAEDAKAELQRARAAYGALAGRVAASDPVLAREVGARMAAVTSALHNSAPPDHYRDLTGPLSDQLMDGVDQALVRPGARLDPGLKAEALRRVVLRMGATYDASATSQGDPDARLAFEESWGLWRRAQALISALKPKLGPETGRVYNTINNLRTSAFKNGPLQLDQPPVAKVDAAVMRVVDALDKRFGLSD